MRIHHLLATGGFVLAGIALLVPPSLAAPGAAQSAFVPTRFTVEDQGTVGKPDVILVPGLSSPRAVWDAEAKLLAPNYRLHLVQVGGFAGAPAGPNASGPLLVPIVEELHAYIVANKLHPVVIGHSLGGLLTLMLAARHPEDVSRLVIVDTLPYYGVLLNPEATVETMKPQVDMIRQQKLVAARSIASDRPVVVEAMVEDLQTDLRGDVASIATPALMLYAYDAAVQQPDPVKYEATVRAAYKPMPNVTLVRVDDSRHFIMYDQPEKLDAAIEGFLK
jgi:pimeloyl-ACP methyl ester carboxylesterase